MQSATIIRSAPVDVASRLEQLGLSEPDLVQVVLGGLAGWNSCTAYHPVTAPGFYFYAEGTAVAREVYGALGWIPHRVRGVEATLNVKTGLALAVLGGDEKTGRPSERPSTRSRKGSEVRKMLSRHPVAPTLPGLDIPPVIRPALTAPGVQTWVLLCHVDEDADEVRAELSWPARMGQSDVISDWLERIILTAQPAGGSPQTTRKGDSPESPSDNEIEVPVSRKVG